MARLEIDLGPLGRGVTVLLERKPPGFTQWTRLGIATESVTRWTFGESDEIRATPRNEDGRPGKPLIGKPQTTTITDRRAPSTLTPITPAVSPDGPSLNIVPTVPAGENPDEYEVEVVQSEKTTAAKTGVHVGWTRPGDTIKAHLWPDGQAISTRLVRREDGQRSAWDALDVETPAASVEASVGHTNDFASGSIAKLGGANGNEPLEISSGDLRQAAIYIGDADGYIGDHDDVKIGDAGAYWSPATYTTDTVVLDEPEHLQFQVWPDMTSITRQTMYIGNAKMLIREPRINVDGSVHEPRIVSHHMLDGADQSPLDMDFKVATSALAAPSFVDDDFAEIVPGKVYPDVKAYEVRVVIRTHFDMLATIDNLKVWHWIYCKSRPWCSYSDGFELVHEHTLASAALSHSIAISGDDWDELRLQVRWKNADASASRAFFRFNTDSGSNYTFGGSTITAVRIGGTLTIAQNESEDARVVLHPKSGVVRLVHISENPRWTATATTASVDPVTFIWENTADEITSIDIEETLAAGTPFAAGSIFRLWGKRHHEA